MKNLLQGLKRAKLRTVLSFLIVLIMSLGISVSSYMLASAGGMGAKNGAIPDISSAEQNSGDSSTSENESLFQQTTDDSSSGDESAADSNQQSTETSVQNGGNDKQQPPDEARGANPKIKWIISIIAIFIIGTALLFIVNFISTKKRNSEFIEIISNGVALKQVKKQLFLEAFIVVLAAGIIGSGVGAAISKPASSLIMSNAISQKNEEFDGTGRSEDFSGGNPSGEFDAGSRPEIPSDENQPGGDPPSRPEGGDDNETNGNLAKMNPNGGGAGAWGYILCIIISLAASAVSAVISGIACYLPVKKATKTLLNKENVNE